jgi:transcriptional regulator with XRE-family HTH domain
MTFGQRLRELRRDAGVTQRELAQRTNLDFSYISKLENDRNPPPAADTIVRICEALSIPAERLLALKGRLPSEIQETVAGNVAAQEFLRVTHTLGLSQSDWKHLSEQARRLRNKPK